MSVEQGNQLNNISRRSFLRGTVGGLLIGGAVGLGIKDFADYLTRPRPKPATPLSAVPTVGPPPSVELPSGVRQLEKSQRVEAERTFKKIQQLFEEYLPQSIFTAADKSIFERVYAYDDAAFTLWVRESQKSKFDADVRKEYWNFNLQDGNHKFVVEFQHNQRLLGASLAHIQGRLNLKQLPQLNEALIPNGSDMEVRLGSMENFIKSALKLPSNLDFEVKGDSILLGTSAGGMIMAYATHLGVIGLIQTNTPLVFNPYVIESDHYGVPQIIPEGNPGGFPRG